VWKEGTLTNVMIIITVTVLANRENIMMIDLRDPPPDLPEEAAPLRQREKSFMSAISAAHSLKMN